MEIPSKYNPAEIEDKWYKYWMENKFFHSEPDEREPYTIVIPPPNVTWGASRGTRPAAFG